MMMNETVGALPRPKPMIDWKHFSKYFTMLQSKLTAGGSFLFIGGLFFAGVLVCLTQGVPVAKVMEEYQYSVLALVLAMEIFTNCVARSRIMQAVAVCIGKISKGQVTILVGLLAMVMFLTSMWLNNVTAVLLLLPPVGILLKNLEFDQKKVNILCAAILAACNLGGAATPVGDLPAILLLNSKLVGFTEYLVRALPFCLGTVVVVVGFWCLMSRIGSREDRAAGGRKLAVLNLNSQYKNVKVHTGALKGFAVIMAAMMAGWCTGVFPNEVVALLGVCAALAVCVWFELPLKLDVDLNSLLIIAGFLFLAGAVSATDFLPWIVGLLQEHIHDPKLLMLAVMLMAAITSGAFSAGAATSVLLPVVQNLCQGGYGLDSRWAAVAFGAAICGGSSLLLSSATAGFVLSGKIEEADIRNSAGHPIRWGILQYLPYGMINFTIQLAIAVVVMWQVM